jgi:ABC-2 type transport system permease protein
MGDLMAAEWIKLRSVRSTYLALAGAAVLAVGVGGLNAHFTAAHWAGLAPDIRASFDPLTTSFSGLVLAQLAMATLGVLAMGSEYGSGLIRTTLVAAPRRPAVLAAKAAVVGAVALGVGEVVAVACFVTGQLLLRPAHVDVPLTGGAQLAGTAAAGLYLGMVALIGLGVGTLLRHTAGALAAAVALLFLAQPLVLLLPESWRTRAATLMPPGAAQQATALHPDPHLLGRAPALLIILAWAATALLTATLTLQHRDP